MRICVFFELFIKSHMIVVWIVYSVIIMHFWPYKPSKSFTS